jgi:hypothetical protein
MLPGIGALTSVPAPAGAAFAGSAFGAAATVFASISSTSTSYLVPLTLTENLRMVFTPFIHPLF